MEFIFRFIAIFAIPWIEEEGRVEVHKGLAAFEVMKPNEENNLKNKYFTRHIARIAVVREVRNHLVPNKVTAAQNMAHFFEQPHFHSPIQCGRLGLETTTTK